MLGPLPLGAILELTEGCVSSRVSLYFAIEALCSEVFIRQRYAPSTSPFVRFDIAGGATTANDGDVR
jgi:hypothetical protein